MSLMSYTFAAKTLGEELTVIITMPEKSPGEQLPFSTVILIPDIVRESNFFMRNERLEQYGRGQMPVATVSLPGRTVLHDASLLHKFFMDELPAVLNQFPLKPIALYAERNAAVRLSSMGKVLESRYAIVRVIDSNGTLNSFMEDVMKASL